MHVEDMIVASIAEKYKTEKANVFVHAEQWNDFCEIGQIDLTFPKKTVFNGYGSLHIVDTQIILASTQTLLTSASEQTPEQPITLLHYAGRQYFKQITDRYDPLDAFDDFQIGIMRNLRLLGDYRKEMFALGNDGCVTGMYRDLCANDTIQAHIKIGEIARASAESILRDKGLTPKEIWPIPKNDSGTIIAIENNQHDKGTGVFVLAHEDGTYYISQLFHAGPQVGDKIEFQRNNNNGYTTFMRLPEPKIQNTRGANR